MFVDESMHVVFDEANQFFIKNICDDEPDNEVSNA
jgi:hypothetical protein